MSLLVVAGIAAYGLFELNRRQEEKAKARVQAARSRIEAAQSAARPREWEVIDEIDPASGATIPRRAAITSDDGLCRLMVEERITGVRLTSIFCNALGVDRLQDDLNVKFDNRQTSDRMKLERFSGGSGVYIPVTPAQYPYNRGYLDYDEFLKRLSTAHRVALELDFQLDGFRRVGRYWIAFSLDSSEESLSRIGALR